MMVGGNAARSLPADGHLLLTHHRSSLNERVSLVAREIKGQ